MAKRASAIAMSTRWPLPEPMRLALAQADAAAQAGAVPVGAVIVRAGRIIRRGPLAGAGHPRARGAVSHSRRGRGEAGRGHGGRLGIFCRLVYFQLVPKWHAEPQGIGV